MWLIVGLGNPGRKYERNRHNIGFRVVDELARRHGMGGFRDRFGGEVASGALSVGGRPHKAVLLKPMEFMNLSGFAVQRAVQFHDIDIDKLIVIHDEIDIDFGRLKLKSGGGHGGHNGLRSIAAQLATGDFLRIRVGVGKPGPKAGSANEAAAKAAARDRDTRVAGYVLSDFPSDVSAEVDALIARAADAAEAIVGDGIRAAMNKFHIKDENSV